MHACAKVQEKLISSYVLLWFGVNVYVCVGSGHHCISGRECVWVLWIGRYNNVLCGRKREGFENGEKGWSEAVNVEEDQRNHIN